MGQITGKVNYPAWACKHEFSTDGQTWKTFEGATGGTVAYSYDEQSWKEIANKGFRSLFISGGDIDVTIPGVVDYSSETYTMLNSKLLARGNDLNIQFREVDPTGNGWTGTFVLKINTLGAGETLDMCAYEVTLSNNGEVLPYTEGE